MRRALLLGLALWLALGLGGCGAKELHQRFLIRGMGVDWDEGACTVTLRAATAAQTGEELLTCQGETLAQALSQVPLLTGREAFYSHNTLVVFGRSCGEGGLGPALEFLLEEGRVRPTAQAYLAGGTAAEVLSLEGEGALEELEQLSAAGQAEGWAVSTDLLGLVNGALRPGSSAVLPVVEVRGDRAAVTGAAYFRGDRLAGELSPEEARGYLALVGDLHRGPLTVEAGGRQVELTLAGGSTRREVEITREGEGGAAFSLTLEARAQGAGVSEEAKRAAEEALAGEMEAALGEALGEGCDIFGFGNTLSQRYPRWWEEHADGWAEEMGRCEYEIAVEVS